MRKHRPQNGRIKRQYFTYLEEAGRMNASSVDQVAWQPLHSSRRPPDTSDFGAFSFRTGAQIQTRID